MTVSAEAKSQMHNFDLITPNNQLKAVGVTGPIYNVETGGVYVGGKEASKADPRGHKRLIGRKDFPVKVTNLNNMVQIRKRKPKMKYNDKLQYRCN